MKQQKKFINSIQIKYLIKENNYISTIIVGHSSDDGSEQRKLFLEAGVDFIMNKPIKFQELKDFLNENFK